MSVWILVALVGLLASSRSAKSLDQLVAYFVFDCCKLALVLGMFVFSAVLTILYVL